MADLGGVIINNGAIGANTLGNDDAISGIVIGSVAATGLALNVAKRVTSLKEINSIGLDEAFDKDNAVNVYRHLSEFYRNSTEGVPLWMMLVPQATTAVEILEDTVANANDAPAKQLLIEAGGAIRQMAIALNPTAAPVVLNGINADIFAAIPKAQLLHQWAFDNFMPLQVLLEGRDYSGDVFATQNLRAIPNVNAPKVSVILGQDWDYAETLADTNGGSAVYLKTFADVGSVLGTLSICEINQNIGDNEAFNITNDLTGHWKTAGLSNHKTNKSQFGDLQKLEDRGYIFGFNYSGLQGVRWNGDHVCVEIIQDAQGNINEHSIALGRTNDKAIRSLRAAYLPKLKTKQPTDPRTGKLPVGVVKYFDGIGEDVFSSMVLATEISGGDVKTNPESDLTTQKLLEISFQIVAFGNVGEIAGTINTTITIN